MKKNLRILTSIVAVVIILTSLAACSSSTFKNQSDSKVYIRVNGESLSKNYIGYFFYLASDAMLEEAGYKSESATADDIKLFWDTTEIDGENAVDVARNTAAQNAVSQKVQYLKALDEGIALSDEELKNIESDIQKAADKNGGQNVFDSMLSDMGTDMDAYKQIITENAYINKLFKKYEDEGIITVTEKEIDDFISANPGVTDRVLGANFIKSEKFNSLAKVWESEATVDIYADNIKEYDVK